MSCLWSCDQFRDFPLTVLAFNTLTGAYDSDVDQYDSQAVLSHSTNFL